MTAPPEPLRAPHTVAFAYERSVGGATEAFLRGLARAEILGSRMPDGRVVVPPIDHDPVTGAVPSRLEPVADTGVVRSWTSAPGEPTAFALVELDGADTSLLHLVDGGANDELTTGMRVRADWRAARTGSIRDIRAFVPETRVPSSVPQAEAPSEITVTVDAPLHYSFEPGITLSAFFRALGDRRIEGGRCPTCEKVYVPPHPQCPVCGSAPLEQVPVTDVGTVVSRAVVHLPVPGMDLDLPFAWAWIRLDEADVPFAHLVGEVEPETVHVGQRVEAVWLADHERPASWEAIRWFRPTDVPS